MQITKRELDNLVNKINKRLVTLRDRLGDGTEYYQELSSAIAGTLPMNLPNDMGISTNVSRVRWIQQNGGVGIQTIQLSRSYKTWQAFADKYGEDTVMEYLRHLEGIKGYLEASAEVPVKYEQKFGYKSTASIQEQAEAIAMANDKISDAWTYLYSVGYMPEVKTLLEKARKSSPSEELNAEAVGLAEKVIHNQGMGKQPNMNIKIGGQDITLNSPYIHEWRVTRAKYMNMVYKEMKALKQMGLPTDSSQKVYDKLKEANIDEMTLDDLKDLWGKR